jgi:hypothetical protein
VEKVFNFWFRIEQLQGSRRRPRVPLKAIWGSVFFLFALRQRSLHAMEGQLRQPRRMERLTGQKKPSADRMGQVLSSMDPNRKIRAWDAEGFTTPEGIEVPLRVLRTEEVIILPRSNAEFLHGWGIA